MEIEQLGFTKEELQGRLIERLADRVLLEIKFSEEDGEFCEDSQFGRKLTELVQERIDQTISSQAEKYLLPRVSEFIENLTLQETNEWGEKKGAPVTFIEYLVARAEAYMQEKLNYNGKTKAEDSYSWSGTQTRITYLIHQHLHYSIETAMKEALKNANSSIIGGIQEAVKMKLAEVAAQFKVEVKTK